MDWITDRAIWIAIVPLTTREIVLGIDNIVFISILVRKLPQEQQARARTIGLALAMVTRVLLLLTLAWIVRLTAPLFAVLGHEISGRDLILIGGGLFLVAKSTRAIHHTLEGEDRTEVRGYPSFRSSIIQILLLDNVFSLELVITAVGMVDEVGVMIAAVIVAVGVMLFSTGPIGRFVDRHPTVKMLALSFLLLFGVTLHSLYFYHFSRLVRPAFCSPTFLTCKLPIRYRLRDAAGTAKGIRVDAVAPSESVLAMIPTGIVAMIGADSGERRGICEETS